MQVAAADHGRSVTAADNISPYLLKRDPYSSHSTILKMLGAGCGRSLLDLGAAQGDMAQLLTGAGFRVTAVEGDPHLAALANDKCHRVVVADLDKPLPRLDTEFDVAVCGDVLEHLQAPLMVLKDIKQQLKPTSLVVISVPNIAHLWMRWQLATGRFNYMDRGILDRTHLRFFTLKSFRQLLKDAGLTILELTATPVPLPLLVSQRYHGSVLDAVHGTSALLARTWKTMFGYQFIATARNGDAA